MSQVDGVEDESGNVWVWPVAKEGECPDYPPMFLGSIDPSTIQFEEVGFDDN